MKEKLLLVLMLIAAVFVMPRVYADVSITIEDNTQSDTLTGSKAGATTSGDVTTITYTTGDFKLLAATTGGSTDNENRPPNKAWIGFRVTFPTTGITNYTLRDEKAGNDLVTNGTVSSSDYVLDVYVGFNDETLRKAVDNATNVEYTYTLTVNTSSNGTITKTIKVIIVPEKITIKDENGSEKLWDNAEYKEEVEKVMNKLYNDLDATVSVAKGYDFSKYTAESVKALEDAIAEAEAALANKNLTTNNQAAVIALRNAITNAITNLVVKGDEPVKPGSTNTDTSKPGEQAPNTFDAGLTYVGLALSAVGASVVSIKKLRNN